MAESLTEALKLAKALLLTVGQLAPCPPSSPPPSPGMIYLHRGLIQVKWRLLRNADVLMASRWWKTFGRQLVHF